MSTNPENTPAGAPAEAALGAPPASKAPPQSMSVSLSFWTPSAGDAG